jgi:dTDP-glucose 4,6-dehydratase
MSKILVTGGAGFIGSNFLNLFVPRHPQHQFLNVDALTYAGNLQSLQPIEKAKNLSLERVDIANRAAIEPVVKDFDPDWIVHFAAESHVDRSIVDPGSFIQTNIVGTYNLLQACRAVWTTDGMRMGRVFHHVSTDEVFGSLGDEGHFDESSRYDPSSPYSASKAASDHLVRAYHRTFGVPVKITNCSNNYGPRQFPEKLIPLMILNAFSGQPLPVYGKGMNVRDWLHVEDHCEAIWLVLEKGGIGETYMIGGRAEMANIDVVKSICRIVAEETGRKASDLEALIKYVQDRPGHDHRYAIDPRRMEKELGWTPRETFESGMKKTVRWYKENTAWVDSVRTGAYKDWLTTNYDKR